MSIKLTEIAAKEVQRLINQKREDKSNGKQDKPVYLRVSVMNGGCSGLSYQLDLTESKTEHDDASTQHGVEVICDTRSMHFLTGTTIDFKDELMGRGFVFDNPQAAKSCNCGSSFSA